MEKVQIVIKATDISKIKKILEKIKQDGIITLCPHATIYIAVS